MGVLLEDAEQAVDEAEEANYVHCSDVLALQQGGEEAPQRPQDDQALLEAILGDIRNSLGFLTAGQHAQVLNVLAMVAMWQTQQGAHVVDTQTTEEGDTRGPCVSEARRSWQPRTMAAQCPQLSGRREGRQKYRGRRGAHGRRPHSSNGRVHAPFSAPFPKRGVLAQAFQLEPCLGRGSVLPRTRRLGTRSPFRRATTWSSKPMMFPTPAKERCWEGLTRSNRGHPEAIGLR